MYLPAAEKYTHLYIPRAVKCFLQSIRGSDWSHPQYHTNLQAVCTAYVERFAAGRSRTQETWLAWNVFLCRMIF